jgi:hypothetical protein
MDKPVSDRCPICHKRGQMMHTDKLVRALGVHMGWNKRKQPLAVCQPCHSVLFAHRFLVLQEAAREPSVV